MRMHPAQRWIIRIGIAASLTCAAIVASAKAPAKGGTDTETKGMGSSGCSRIFRTERATSGTK